MNNASRARLCSSKHHRRSQSSSPSPASNLQFTKWIQENRDKSRKGTSSFDSAYELIFTK